MAYTNIDDPSAYFHTQLYTGAGSELVITNDGNSDLQPDFIWIKQRNTGQNHNIYDSNRGATTMLYPDLTNAEYSAGESLKSFNTDGFTVGNYGTVGTSGGTYVAWQWKANGGTTASNTDGNITSTVQVNQDAGFSIVTYTGNGSNNQTIGHGLGVQPSWWVVKNRSGGSTNWLFGASSILGGTSNYLKLNDTSANTEYNNIWGDSPTSSTLFRVSNLSHLNTNGSNYVAYLFANKQGYSKFGKYVGNGAIDGPFVYTGFKPAFVLIKNVDTTQVWIMYDGARKPFNRDDNVASLYANTAGAEYTGASYHNLDILSNGFKIRLTDASQNGNGNNHIYMAFAENPFTTSTGIPTTAR